MYRFADFPDDAAFRFAQARLGAFRLAPAAGTLLGVTFKYYSIYV
jgi:hypothetical protein